MSIDVVYPWVLALKMGRGFRREGKDPTWSTSDTGLIDGKIVVCLRILRLFV